MPPCACVRRRETYAAATDSVARQRPHADITAPIRDAGQPARITPDCRRAESLRHDIDTDAVSAKNNHSRVANRNATRRLVQQLTPTTTRRNGNHAGQPPRICLLSRHRSTRCLRFCCRLFLLFFAALPFQMMPRRRRIGSGYLFADGSSMREYHESRLSLCHFRYRCWDLP